MASTCPKTGQTVSAVRTQGGSSEDAMSDIPAPFDVARNLPLRGSCPNAGRHDPRSGLNEISMETGVAVWMRADCRRWGSALAQNPPPATRTPLYDPQQLPMQRGEVQQFTLTPRGDIDGLILTDGTEVKTPPHLSTEIAYSVKPGDTVTIHGLRAAALPLVQAVSITDEQTGRTVVDNGPPGTGRRPGAPPTPAPWPGAPAAGPAAPIPGLTEVQGRVRMSLHGPQGDVNGA